MNKNLLYLARLVIIAVLVITGCVNTQAQPQQSDLVKVAWKEVKPEYLQSDYGEQLRPYYLYGDADLFLNQQGLKALGAETKVMLVKRGEAPSGGYGVKVKEISLNPQKQLVVQLEKINPQPGQAVTLATTYPMVAVCFPDDRAKEIVFEPELSSLAVKPLTAKKPVPFTGRLDAFEIPANRGGYLYPLVGLNQVETLIIVREPTAQAGSRMEWIDLQINDSAEMLTARVRLVPPEDPSGNQITPLTLAGKVVGDYRSYLLKVEYMTDENGVSLDVKQGLVSGVRPYMAVPMQMYPSPELLGPIGELRHKDPFTILGCTGRWTEIRTRGAQGWIPSWYLEPNQDSQPIQRLEKAEMRVAKSSTPVSLHPTGPVVQHLEAGKLLKVEYRFRDWAFVDIIVYDIPAVQFGWVKEDSLTTLDQATPIEGYLKLGANTYHDFEHKQFYETATFSRAVKIHERRGNMAYIIAAGAWAAWTELGNIVYQPE